MLINDCSLDVNIARVHRKLMTLTLKEHTIGQMIRAARVNRSLTQGTVAQYLGVTKAAVCAWETDTRPPSVEHLLGISRLLRVPMAALVTGHESAEPLPLGLSVGYDNETQAMIRLFLPLDTPKRDAVLQLLAQMQEGNRGDKRAGRPKATYTPPETETVAA